MNYFIIKKITMDNLEIQAFLQQFGNVEISNVNRILRFSENKDKENLYFL
jgi:hypothetical protein